MLSNALKFIFTLARKVIKFVREIFYGPTPVPPVIPPVKPKPAASVSINVKIDGIPVTGVQPMSLTLRGKKQEIALNPVFIDEDGISTTELGSIPQWTSSNPSVLSVEAAEDGLSAVARVQGVGVAQIQLQVDADPAADVEVTITGTVDVEVKPGLAVMVELNPTIRAVVLPVDPEPEVPVDPQPETPVVTDPETPADPQPEVPVEPAPVEPDAPAPGGEGGEPQAPVAGEGEDQGNARPV